MYLNSSLLYEQLSARFDVSRSGPSDRTGTLAPPLLFYPEMELCPGHIYVGRGESFVRTAPAGACIVCTGAVAETVLRAGAVCLAVPQELDIGRVFNEIQGIFDRFTDWKEKADRMILSNCSIQEFLDHCRPLFPGNFLLATNNSRRVVGLTCEADYVMDETGQTPIAVFNRFKSSPEYLKNQTSHELYLYWEPHSKHDILSKNIFLNDKLVGWLSLTEREEPITDGRWFLFSKVSEIYTRLYRQLLYMPGSSAKTPVAVFSKLLEGKSVPRAELEDSVKTIGWDGGGEYIVCLVEMHESDKKIRSLSYFIQRMEALLSYAVPVELDGNIVVVMNTAKDTGHGRGSEQKFRDFLKESRMCAGVSDSFYDLLRLEAYFRQAEAAMRIGIERRPDEQCHHFSDYVLTYMLENMTGEISGELLCPKGLIAMRDADAGRRFSYLKTLDAYFRTGCNATQASRDLYINRSTFLARMERINELLGLDMDDYETRLYLMLCMKLLNY